MKQEAKLIIGLDLDGVIVDNTENKIRFAKQFGFDLNPEQTPAALIEKILPEDVLNKLRELLYHNPATALTADLVTGAKEGLAAIKKSGLPYFLISRRKKPEIAVELLKKHGLWPDYFSKANAFFVNEPEDKNRMAVRFGVNVYLDDEPHVLEKLTSVPRRFLFDRFRQFDGPPMDYQKVASWKEFLTHLA